MNAKIARGVPVENVSTAELYNVITGAASQDPQQVGISTKRLKKMLEMSGTYDALQEMATQRTLPLPVRQQSIIQFKNAALNQWRTRKVTDEQRVRIRARCMSFMDEEDEIIAGCNQVIVAKLARIDLPSGNWSALMPELTRVIDTNLQLRYTSNSEEQRTTLILRRSLRLLNALLKEFWGYKMLGGVKVMAQTIEELRLVFYGYYSKISSSFASTTLPLMTLELPRTTNDILIAHLVYKCIVNMATWLWNRYEKTGKEELQNTKAWFHELFQNSALQLKTLVELRTNVVKTIQGLSAPPSQRTWGTIEILTRHIRLFGKFFRRLQDLEPSRFVELPMCSDLVLYYWAQVVEATSGPPEMIADSNTALFPVRFLVQALVLFKDSLSQWAPLRKNGIPNENSLSQEFVQNAVRLLVTRFMPLNPSDLEGWMADPEEWVSLEDKESDQWEFELRPCSERVLMTLSNQYGDYVTPLLEATFRQSAIQSSSDLPSLIQKEALYCAIGRCSSRLKDVIPFEQWLNQTLAIEARETNPVYPIIKRRIAWLLGKWIGNECSPATNPQIWEVLIYLLQDRGPGTDDVVRLTAALALRECVDTVSFDANVFTPFLPAAVTELLRLIGEAETVESKRRVANSLNTVIERAEMHIVPYTGLITTSLPQLWLGAREEWLFKSSLLVTLTKLVESVKEQSTALGSIIVPIIRESLSSAAITFLDEDALILWLAALRNTLTIQSVNGAPGLVEIFPLAVLLLGTNLDLLGKLINIFEAYLLLDATRLLQSFSVDLFQAFLTVIRSGAVLINIKGMVIALNLLFQLAPSSSWGEALHVSGLFTYLITTLIDGEQATTLLTEFIYVFARMIMADRQMFLQLMSATASGQNLTETFLYDGLLDQWLGKFDNMSEPRQRKLAAMGIASLVSTGRPEVLQRLPIEIFDLWLDVFGEIKEAKTHTTHDGSSSPSSSNIHRFWELDDAPVHYYQNSQGTPEYERRKAVFDRDPVRAIQLNAYIGPLLRETEAVCGAEKFQAHLSRADPAVLKQIQDELVRDS